MAEQLIEEFIKLVKDSVPDAEEVFTSGNCGSFARMLLFAFPSGKIMKYLQDHFVFEYRGFLYDITGDVTNKYPNKNLTDINNINDINEVICSLSPKYKK